MLMNYHISRLVLSSLCVGALVASGIWWCSFCRLQDATYSVYYISVASSTFLFYILLYIFKNIAFDHPPLFYVSHSSRPVTFNTTNLEF